MQGLAHMIWLGDFNRHHPHWDKHNNTQLFTKDAIKAAKMLIEVTGEVGLDMALPGGIPTHVHNVMKRWTRINQVYISDHSTNLINECNTVTLQRGINTDHLPILTKLDLATPIAEESAIHNFRDVDWEQFNKGLERQLARLRHAEKIDT